MDGVRLHQLQRFVAVIRAKDVVAVRSQIDLQRGHDVLFVVADKNGVHVIPLSVSDYTVIIAHIFLKNNRGIV